MSKSEIGITKLANRFAETGDVKILLAVHKLQEAGFGGPAVNLAGPASLSPVEPSQTDKAILQWFIEANRSSDQEETPRMLPLSAQLFSARICFPSPGRLLSCCIPDWTLFLPGMWRQFAMHSNRWPQAQHGAW
ncbi:hypothetical protein GGR20_000887 [Devosia subaequoris]|uniref:Uncharacterized protein n=1 Tax=Devosia subaequoris TaxID=395930 RepID=A0A7W6NB21_9HYPH|nr:hypothetical protein [Devosia subaequoris]MBB4051269.1 hypothetical protein [Devosia subaequoris]MCP1211429.1 hypothetical protein [Devosia subaequoris]